MADIDLDAIEEIVKVNKIASNCVEREGERKRHEVERQEKVLSLL